VILKDDFDCTNVNDIKVLYHQAYYPVAIQLLEKGLTEAEIKVKFRTALIFLCEQQKKVAFDYQNKIWILFCIY